MKALHEARVPWPEYRRFGFIEVGFSWDYPVNYYWDRKHPAKLGQFWKIIFRRSPKRGRK